jgi:hypothetical protein
MYITNMPQIEQTVSGTKKISDPSFHSWEELVTSYLQGIRAVWGQTTEYTQNGNGNFLAYVNSIMMEKSAQTGEGGGSTSTPFHYVYHHVQSCGFSSWEGRYTLPISTLPQYVLCGTDCLRKGKNLIFHFTVERNWWRHTCRGDVGSNHRVHTERHWPLSGVYFTMMEKAAHPGEGGGGDARPTPFNIYQLERADTLPLFLLEPFMYSVGQTSDSENMYVHE